VRALVELYQVFCARLNDMERFIRQCNDLHGSDRLPSFGQCPHRGNQASKRVWDSARHQ
jgi:hypothetical protein